MQTIEIDFTDASQVKQFLKLPFQIYRGVPQWVPPLQMEERNMLDHQRNPYFRHSKAAFFLAYEGKEPVGRLAVLNHHPYNNYNQERTAFFYLFECRNEPAAAGVLFEAACTWAMTRGLNRMIGPKGFSPLNGMGLLVEGFEHRPALGIPYNPAYYPELLEGCGFSRKTEIVSGYLSATMPFPERIHEVARLVQERRGLRVIQFKRRADLRRIAPQLKDLYNLSIEGTTGNYPISDEDAKTLADQLLRFADPSLIKIIMKGDDIAGFLFAYPDISAAQQRTGGRLFPFGWVSLMLEMRNTKWVNINGMGILKEFRGAGGTALLFSEMQKSIVQRGFLHADLVQIGSENDPMLRELRSFGVQFYKKHSIFEKWLED